MTKYVYSSAGKAEGSSVMRNLLGGKGCELAEMTKPRYTVPPGFTIRPRPGCTTTGRIVTWRKACGTDPRAPQEARGRGEGGLGDRERPLLVSVRSGARVSMPGMMETVLNLGLNDETVEGLATRTGNERFAWDCYRRFVTMFSDVVLGIRREVFEEHLVAVKDRLGVTTDPEVPAVELRKLVQTYKDLVLERTGAPFPQDPPDQLRLAINAVFESWWAKKAVEYRRIHEIPADWGTAVTVMSIVFGNWATAPEPASASPRDPRTASPSFYAEFLSNAHGEDVVSGIRTARADRGASPADACDLRSAPRDRQRLERHYKDMHDLEFTIQEGRLFLLQTRSGKRSARAAVRVARDLVQEHVIDQHTALLRVKPQEVNEAIRPVFDPREKARAIAEGRLLARGLAAAPGAAVGQVVFDADRAVEWSKMGQKVILARAETSPEDVAGMYASEGIVTARGGRTSHAAVVAVGMGKSCVVGASDIVVDEERRAFIADGRTVREGDVISIDGGTGEVILDAVETVEGTLGDEVQELLLWADRYRKDGLGVRANADTPVDAQRAREVGAEGIGLVRTEHMFFAPERIPIMREMIMAPTVAAQQTALDRLQLFQRDDFVGIFRAMDGLPAPFVSSTRRSTSSSPRRRTTEMVEERSRLEALGHQPRAAALLEHISPPSSVCVKQPMLGPPRLLRLGIPVPPNLRDAGDGDSWRRRVSATEWAARRARDHDPAHRTVGEMRETYEQTTGVAEGVVGRSGVPVNYGGTMIEVPRARSAPIRSRSTPVLLVRHQRPPR